MKYSSFSQFVLFSAVGAVGTAAHYIVLIVLVQVFSFNPVPSSAAGFVVGACVNYWLNYHFTFKSKSLHRIASLKFFTVALAGFGFNLLIMAISTTWLHYLLSQFIATGLTLIWNFLFSRYWAFKEVDCVK